MGPTDRQGAAASKIYRTRMMTPLPWLKKKKERERERKKKEKERKRKRPGKKRKIFFLSTAREKKCATCYALLFFVVSRS
jgi:hypothetical protein